MNFLLILLGKMTLLFSTTFNLGAGSTWPGHIALETNSNFIKQIFNKNKHIKIVLIAGTNGKTTTAFILQRILEKKGYKVFRNESGANLLNGIASSLIQNINLTGWLNYDVAIFEIDEKNVSLALKEFSPYTVILLNIFRDQLDRYGEVNSVLNDWTNTLKTLDKSTLLFANGDDPSLSYLAQQSDLETRLFGINEELMTKRKPGHDVDFTYCPSCQTKLNYNKVSYSHMGDFICPNCDFKRQNVSETKIDHYPLFGKYNIYNTNAAFTYRLDRI